MQNGNTVIALIEEATAVTATTSITAYYAASLPDETDNRLRHIVIRFTAFAPDQRSQFLENLTPEPRSMFGIFGHRAATLAAREKSPDWLRSGLTGYVMANYTIPQGRQVKVGLAVYYHVARLLGLNPVTLFGETAVYATPEMEQEMWGYGRDGKISLHQYGWRELKTPDGIRYKFDPTS
ncbi:MAG: hypothetical protein HF973_14215 [Chloroflexi bacterium]|nr:hypothetical protein [Chloroflexota bacterium]